MVNRGVWGLNWRVAMLSCYVRQACCYNEQKGGLKNDSHTHTHVGTETMKRVINICLIASWKEFLAQKNKHHICYVEEVGCYTEQRVALCAVPGWTDRSHWRTVPSALRTWSWVRWSRWDDGVKFTGNIRVHVSRVRSNSWLITAFKTHKVTSVSPRAQCANQQLAPGVSTPSFINNC